MITYLKIAASVTFLREKSMEEKNERTKKGGMRK